MSNKSYKHECHCCGTKTVQEEPDHVICQECWWHNDGDIGLDEWCYCNGLTLREAKANYAEYGACDPHGYWCKNLRDLSEDRAAGRLVNRRKR